MEEKAKASNIPPELVASKKIIHQYFTWSWRMSDEERAGPTSRCCCRAGAMNWLATCWHSDHKIKRGPQGPFLPVLLQRIAVASQDLPVLRALQQGRIASSSRCSCCSVVVRRLNIRWTGVCWMSSRVVS